MNSKESIAVVWLKRDLRLDDNESIYRALKSGPRVLLLYVFENLLLSWADDPRVTPHTDTGLCEVVIILVVISSQPTAKSRTRTHGHYHEKELM